MVEEDLRTVSERILPHFKKEAPLYGLVASLIAKAGDAGATQPALSIGAALAVQTVWKAFLNTDPRGTMSVPDQLRQFDENLTKFFKLSCGINAHTGSRNIADEISTNDQFDKFNYISNDDTTLHLLFHMMFLPFRMSIHNMTGVAPSGFLYNCALSLAFHFNTFCWTYAFTLPFLQ